MIGILAKVAVVVGAVIICGTLFGQIQRDPADVTLGAVGAERWEVEITGKASHAGAYPEQGISSTLVGALALADVKRQGYFGKIVKGEQKGTSNVLQLVTSSVK